MHKHHLIAVLGFSMATHAMFRSESDTAGSAEAPAQPAADAPNPGQPAPEQSDADTGDEHPTLGKAASESEAAPVDAAAETAASEAAPAEAATEVAAEPEIVANPMRLYQCHKRVHAERIISVGSKSLALENGTSVEVGGDWLDRHNPQVGGYYVEYNDGYTSYSPSAAFEEGYKEVSETAVEDFLSCLGFGRETPQNIIDVAVGSVKHALEHFGIIEKK